MKYLLLLVVGVFLFAGISSVRADDLDDDDLPVVEMNLGASKEGSRTDAEAVQREEEAIKLDGLNVAQIKELREKVRKVYLPSGGEPYDEVDHQLAVPQQGDLLA